MNREQRTASCLAIVVVASQLAGCGAEHYGFMAVGRFDGDLRFAAVVCDSELHEVSVTVEDPGGDQAGSGEMSRGPRGSWSPRDGGRGVHLLDITDPGGKWETVESLESIDEAATSVVVSGRGDTNGNFDSLRFEMQEVSKLGEDEWIYAVEIDGSIRRMTDDLTTTALEQCE